MTSIAMVTGAGSGIGRAVALKLAAVGTSVFLVGRRAESLEETRSLAGADNLIVAPTDVTDAAAVEQLFATVRSKAGRLDLLFNNAGTNSRGVTPDEMPVEEWSHVIATNLTGAFLVARAAFTLMRAQNPQGGRIINNGSVSAHNPRPNSIAYTASKHAVTGLTKSLSLDGRPFNIACGQIDIGNAATEMAAQISKGVLQADGSIRAEPTIRPDDVANAVAYMAGLPLDANVQFMTLLATNMPFVGRG